MLRTRMRLFCVALIAISTAWLVEPVQAQSKSPLKLAHAADEDALFAVIWNGLGEPNPDSTNRTQKLLAEQSLRDFMKDLSAQVDIFWGQTLRVAGIRNTEFVRKATPLLSKSVFAHPSLIVVNRIGAKPEDLQAAVVLEAGEDVAAFQEIFDELVEMDSQDASDKASIEKIGGGKFHRISATSKSPLTYLGTLGSRVIFAWGNDTIQPLIARLQQSKSPKWVETQLADLPVDQPNLLAYANVKKIIATLEKDGTVFDLNVVAKAYGLDSVNHFSLVGGFDAVGMHVNTLVSFQGEPRGLLALLPNKPLTIDAFRRVPASVSSATVVRFDLDQALNHFMKMASAFAPTTQPDDGANLDQIEQRLGFSLQKDLAQGLGDEWMLYTASNEGGAMFVPALVLSVTVRDQDKVQKVHDVALGMLKEATESFGARPPFTVHEYTVKGNKAVRVQFNNSPVALSPAWVLTKDEFVFSVLPQSLSSHLSQPGKPSLADSEVVQATFKRQPNPILMSYSDPKPKLRGAYSLINTFGPVVAQQFDQFGFELTPPTLPPLSDLEQHLLPSATTFHFSKDGLRSETRGVVPSGLEAGPASVGALVGLLLPAVEGAREAGRRDLGKRNLKQIGLALLGSEESYLRFPGPAIRDNNEKPLLSWRVQILPFLDQQKLYEQFHLDEPWDSDYNKTLIEKMPRIYASPDDAALNKQGKTTYLAPLGKGTIWDEPRGNKVRNITDGLSNTILVVEAHRDAAVIWTKPNDLPIDFENPWKNLKSVRPGGFQALFGDGAVHSIFNGLNSQTLRGLFTRDGDEDVQDFWNY